MVLSNKEWLDKMNEIISAIQNGGCDSQVIEDMLSNMWISSATYNVGDYVLYNNNIWKCLVQNSNIAPSEGTTWTRVNITSEISTLNSNFTKNTGNPIFSSDFNGQVKIERIGNIVIVEAFGTAKQTITLTASYQLITGLPRQKYQNNQLFPCNYKNYPNSYTTRMYGGVVYFNSELSVSSGDSITITGCYIAE